MTKQIASQLKHILLASDFSTGSDRANRRAYFLAKQFGASMTIVHVVDDDQPKRLAKRARSEAAEVLERMRRTATDVDDIDCAVAVAEGEAFSGILGMAAESDADMIVVGPHRRRLLKDVFVGTTAERTIRTSDRPVLMVNGSPAGPYRRILVATDLSECSVAALRLCDEFGFKEAARLTVAHVFELPAKGSMRRAWLTDDAVADYSADVRARAEGELLRFLTQYSFEAGPLVLRPNESAVANEIWLAAKECSADLIVVGTRGRTGVSKFLLGSVTEELLRVCPCDVLAVPPQDYKS